MKDKIVVKLQGGLGNQLFQYAYAKRMQEMFPEKQIILDISYYRSAHIRSLELQKLSIDSTVEWSEEYRPFFETAYKVFRAEKSLYVKFGKRLKSRPLLEKAGYYFNYAGSDYWKPRKNLKNIYLAGYFQNERQIRPVRDEIIRTIKPKDNLSEKARDYLKAIQQGRSLGISIRAGQDYKDMGWVVCSKAYYLNGIREILADGKERNLFVFSDCLDTIREEGWFKQYHVTYIDGCDAAEGLYLLSSCNDFVIANSTFAWWGAYLGCDREKRIVMPEYFIETDRTSEGGLYLDDAVYRENQPPE